MSKTYDVLIIGAGASGAAAAWSLSQKYENIACLEQGDWMDPSKYPSTNTDWEILKAKNFSLLQKWRLKQERKLWLRSKRNLNFKIMSKGDVINFMQTYQRITQNMFKNMPKYASIIFNLNTNHQIKSAVYKR